MGYNWNMTCNYGESSIFQLIVRHSRHRGFWSISSLGDSSACNGTIEMYDECDRKCMCHKGELLFCRRIREEFTAMSLKERQRFVKVFKTAATNAIYCKDFERIGRFHSRTPSKLLYHTPQTFFPWHRWYLLEFEDFLRQNDCRITIP